MLIYLCILLLLALSYRSGALWAGGYYVKSKKRGYALPAMSPSIPFGIARIAQMMRSFKQGIILQQMQRINDENPETRLWQVLFRWIIITHNFDNIKAVLSTNFKDYDLGIREGALGAAFGRGIFTVSGHDWKKSRTLLRPQFARDQISQLDSVNQHTKKLFKVIDGMQKEQQYVDVQYLFHQFTIDTATDFLFGESLDVLEELTGGEPVKITSNGRTVTATEFVESYTFMVKQSSKRLILGALHWLSDSKEFRAHIARARVVVDYYVDESLRLAKEPAVDNSKYVFSHALAREGLNRTDIRDQIFNILIAGRDTTAMTMTFMVYYLAKNPDIYAKLRQQVLEEFGTQSEDRNVTFEMLRAAKYLNAVINETLRLCPVVPVNQRTAIRDTVLPRGGGPDGQQPIFVPKGLSVTYQCFYFQRNKDVWGPDAEEFRPERWLTKMNIPSWAYLPFNGGPRICLGQQFALTELALMFVRIAQQYQQILPSPSLPDEPALDVSLTIKSKIPVTVQFVKEAEYV